MQNYQTHIIKFLSFSRFNGTTISRHINIICSRKNNKTCGPSIIAAWSLLLTTLHPRRNHLLVFYHNRLEPFFFLSILRSNRVEMEKRGENRGKRGGGNGQLSLDHKGGYITYQGGFLDWSIVFSAEISLFCGTSAIIWEFSQKRLDNPVHFGSIYCGKGTPRLTICLLPRFFFSFHVYILAFFFGYFKWFLAKIPYEF